MSDLNLTKLVRARKPHQCRQCNTAIRPGIRYYHSKGLYDGAWYSDAICVDCQHLGADLYAAGYWSEGAFGEECFPWLPEVDWNDVRVTLISTDWPERIDAYLVRSGRKL